MSRELYGTKVLCVHRDLQQGDVGSYPMLMTETDKFLLSISDYDAFSHPFPFYFEKKTKPNDQLNQLYDTESSMFNVCFSFANVVYSVV
jgi:hypothetical protein